MPKRDSCSFFTLWGKFSIEQNVFRVSIFVWEFSTIFDDVKSKNYTKKK